MTHINIDIYKKYKKLNLYINKKVIKKYRNGYIRFTFNFRKI